jgi:Tfp pilus assembly protein PilF
MVSKLDTLLDGVAASLHTRPGRRLAALALAASVFVAFLPALDAGFLNLDDPKYVTANPDLKSLGWEGLEWAFTTFTNSNWHPVTWLSYMLDRELWGLDPLGFHLTNLILHAANAGLAFLVLGRLTGSPWRSLVVAALFGLHPLRVESVAWVAERKDVLFVFFWFLTMAAHARFARSPRPSSYALVVAAFVLSLSSKTMAVTLPVALLLLDFWPLRRLDARAVLEKVPLLALAAGASLLALLAQGSGNAIDGGRFPLGGRLANAGHSYLRYVSLTLWPDVSTFYEHVAIHPDLFPRTTLAASALLGIATTGLVLLGGRSRPYLPVGWFWYLATLVPAIGLVQVGHQGMADRYSYIPQLGLLIMAVWGVASLPIWSSVRLRAAGLSLAAAVCLTFAIATWKQTRVWRDDLSYWQFTLEKNDRSFMASQMIAMHHAENGRYLEAARLLENALKFRPEVAMVHEHAGDYFLRGGDLSSAAVRYADAAEREPTSAAVQRKLGATLAELARYREALGPLERAAELDPSDPIAQTLLGEVLMELDEPTLARERFEAAHRLAPNSATERLDDAPSSRPGPTRSFTAPRSTPAWSRDSPRAPRGRPRGRRRSSSSRRRAPRSRAAPTRSRRPCRTRSPPRRGRPCGDRWSRRTRPARRGWHWRGRPPRRRRRRE